MTPAYTLGQQAFNDNNISPYNPYTLGTQAWTDWDTGFEDQWDAFMEEYEIGMRLEAERDC